MKLDATKLRSGKWAIRPAETLGTCGQIGGKLWCVKYTDHKPTGIPERSYT